MKTRPSCHDVGGAGPSQGTDGKKSKGGDPDSEGRAPEARAHPSPGTPNIKSIYMGEEFRRRLSQRR